MIVKLVVIVVIGWEAHQTDAISFSANTNKDHEWDREELRELKEKYLALTRALLSTLSNFQRTCYNSLSTPVFFTKEGQYKHIQLIVNLTNLILHCYGLDQDSVPVVYPSRNLFGQDCMTNFQHNIHSAWDYCIYNAPMPLPAYRIITRNTCSVSKYHKKSEMPSEKDECTYNQEFTWRKRMLQCKI